MNKRLYKKKHNRYFTAKFRYWAKSFNGKYVAYNRIHHHGFIKSRRKQVLKFLMLFRKREYKPPYCNIESKERYIPVWMKRGYKILWKQFKTKSGWRYEQ